MKAKDLFVVIYTTLWAAMIAVFATICIVTKRLDVESIIVISNTAFLLSTSIFVFVKPVRKFVNKSIISKL